MFRSLVAILAISLSGFCFAKSTLIISPTIQIDLEPAKTLAHKNRLLIYKYDSWSFSHEEFEEGEIYPGIKLPGMEKEYVVSMFDKDVRSSLPGWLAELSKEQADLMGIDESSVTKKSIGRSEIIAVYNKLEKRGEIFVVSDKRVHRISVKGDRDKYDDLIGAIKER